MDKIDEVDIHLTVAFFFYRNLISFNVAQLPLFNDFYYLSLIVLLVELTFNKYVVNLPHLPLGA